VLTRDEARARAQRVRRVDYGLSFDLEAGADAFRGRADIRLELEASDEPLALDFRGRVAACRIDDRPIRLDHRDHRIHLPGTSLGGSARVVVDYEAPFEASGEGLHRFVDPEDGAEYVYTNLEPFLAHRVFPCLDQPDLKATYRLEVTAPADWRVVSAVEPTSSVACPDGRRRHAFPVTPRFSTYLFPLVAGPFERLGRVHAGIPLGLFGRRSMRRELERSAEEVFEVTAQGLDHFRDLFEQPYPFTKYDQLFVPEFNAGAMENVAAVTLRDDYLFRDPPTWSQRLERAEVVLHELAHMWFGDLVTMRWWDDLWLNETFATYLSYRCLAEATRFEDAWRSFSGQLRSAALRQDQLVTTHPIAADVTDTDGAEANFDAITYEKGAAVMKQLVAHLGEAAFQDGMRLYFRRHAWGSATLADLLAALGEASGRPLDGWADAWLRTASLDTLSVRWRVSGDRLSAMELRQAAPAEHPHLRPHTLRIAIVHAGPERRELRVTSVPAHIDAERADVPEAIGQPAPLLVYPDHGDHGYALIELDPASAAFALERLPELPEALLRQQVWSTLWEMTRAASLPVTDFLGTVGRFAPRETDAPLAGAILERAATALARYVPAPRATDDAAALFGRAVETLAGTDDPDLRITWTRAAISFATRAEDIDRLAALLDGEWWVADFRPDQDMRWGIVTRAMAHDRPGAEARLAAEVARDRSDRGQRMALRARAGRPDAGSKRSVWEGIHGEGFGSDQLTRAAMAGFAWLHQRRLLEPFREPFFGRVGAVFATRDHAFARAYVRWLCPDRWAEPEVLERLRAAARDTGPDEGLLRRSLEEAADDLARAIRVQATAGPGPGRRAAAT
jgi:aminopeptidase N